MSVGDRVHTIRTLAEAGVIGPVRPDKVLRIGRALRRFGPTPAAGYAASDIRHPDRIAIVDELGSLSFREVHRRTNALAHALADRGIVEGDGIAIMCRNHRGFIEATVACSKLGADALYLNTSFAAPQITEVVKRENPRAIVFDEEFSKLVKDAGRRRKRFIGWHGEGKLSDPTLEQLVEEGDPEDVVAPGERGKAVILTSGTTGAPKGASRKQPESLDPAAALLSKIPLRSREPTMIAAPLFHSWGFAHFSLALGLGSTLVLRSKFEPEEALSATAQHQCTALVVVPVMVQRILELAPEAIDRYDLSGLRVIAISGSALSPSLAERAMERFGDVLYNLYGSTEVAWAAIATPEDMRAAPGSVGKPPRGTTLKIYDEEGSEEVEQGETGRIFVGNDMLFEGYTGGGSKDLIDGLMATGDVGHLDEGGRLFVDGRDDEMIVSGGENVFPQEVEELLVGHDDVADVAVVGVEDEEFGQRLRAVIVKRKGAKLGEKDVKEHVKRNLAGYKVPRDVVFAQELPRTSTGKVLKRELADDDED